jgi:hypothetical protein
MGLGSDISSESRGRDQLADGIESRKSAHSCIIFRRSANPSAQSYSERFASPSYAPGAARFRRCHRFGACSPVFSACEIHDLALWIKQFIQIGLPAHQRLTLFGEIRIAVVVLRLHVADALREQLRADVLSDAELCQARVRRRSRAENRTTLAFSTTRSIGPRQRIQSPRGAKIVRL